MPIATRSRKRLPIRVLLLAGSILLGIVLRNWVASAQTQAPYVRLVRAIETDALDIANPAGLAYSPEAEVFFVVGAREPDQLAPPAFDVIRVTPAEDRAGPVRIAASMTNRMNMALVMIQPGERHCMTWVDPEEGIQWVIIKERSAPNSKIVVSDP